MTVAVSKAVEEGAETVIVASTGNTASSAAAYAARAGISAVVLLPEGTVASGKLAQSRMFGALVLQVNGSFDEALAAARELASRGTFALVNSLNPYRREGQKTAVFEIVEELGGGARRDLPPVRRRRQHDGLRPGVLGARRPALAADRMRGPQPARRPSQRRSGSREPAHAATARRRSSAPRVRS